MAKKTKKREVVSFVLRLDKVTADRLRRMADQMSISRNSLIERVLTAGVRFSRAAESSNLFGVLGVEDAMKEAAERAVLEAKRRLSNL